MSVPSLKCVVVGSGYVGKTSMLVSYINNEYPKDYVPTIIDILAMDIKVNGLPYVFNLFDTAGQEEYNQLRPLGYPKTDVFLICFSVIDQFSFEEVENKWVKEVKHFCPRARYILVGTKSDLRKDEKVLEMLQKKNQRVISTRMGDFLAKKINAVKYIECSALTQEGLNQVFEEAIKTAISKPKTTKPICNIY